MNVRKLFRLAEHFLRSLANNMNKSKKKIILAAILNIGIIAILLYPGSAYAKEHRSFVNPITGGGSLGVATIVGRVISGLLTITGLLAVLFIIRSGIMIGLARGNAEQRKKGMQGLTFAIIGLLVTFLGFILVNFILFGTEVTPGLIGEEGRPTLLEGGDTSPPTGPSPQPQPLPFE